jgi:nicotinamide/nicotinate riboside kinase
MSKLIAIGGVSRSGKTTLAMSLSASLQSSTVLHQDDFVKLEHLIPKVRERTDWEHPESIDWIKWRSAIDQALISYDHVIIEGLFALYDVVTNLKIQQQYYLLINKATFIERRKNETRWGNEPHWFVEHVWEAHRSFGLPTAQVTIFQVEQPNEKTVDDIIKSIT